MGAAGILVKVVLRITFFGNNTASIAWFPSASGMQVSSWGDPILGITLQSTPWDSFVLASHVFFTLLEHTLIVVEHTL